MHAAGKLWLWLLCLPISPASHCLPTGPSLLPSPLARTPTGIAATANWVSNALVAQTFLTLTRTLGGSGAFYLYACVACAGLLWTYRFLPETNGLTLDQVQHLFGGSDAGGSSSSRNSGGPGSGGGSWLWSGGGWERKRRASDDGGEGGVAATAAGGS